MNLGMGFTNCREESVAALPDSYNSGFSFPSQIFDRNFIIPVA